MLGDDAQPATSDGSRAGATSGPRHAAPRRSLLTKLHVPAGKAVALAAMPTAVLMGMGLTPHLAQADEPKAPSLAPGACVSQSDTPSPTASSGAAKKDGATDTKKDGAADAKKTGKKTAETGTFGGTDTPTTSASPHATDRTPTPASSPSASSSQSGSGTAAASGGSTAKAPEPTATTAPAATPSPTKSVNPWDPLGLGDLLGGLLGGDEPDPSPSPSASATTPATPAPTTAAPDPTPTGGTGGSDGSGGSTAKGSGSSGADSGKSAKATGSSTAPRATTDATEKAAKAPAEPKATASPTPSSTAASDAAGGADDLAQGYPCPAYDAKALDDASLEAGIPLLPDEPWTLKSSLLTLHGLDYKGIVQVKTASGNVKDVLKFTTTGIDIGDLDQFVVGPGGKGHTEVKAAKNSTSTITGGTTTLYTESLSGNLLGLIPITFTPKAPPPLTLPELFFTDVTVVNAGQFGGDLHIPGMQVLPGQP